MYWILRSSRYFVVYHILINFWGDLTKASSKCHSMPYFVWSLFVAQTIVCLFGSVLFETHELCWSVLPFLPNYRLAHPDNYLFLLSKKIFSGSKYPKHILFNFEKGSTDADCFVAWRVFWQNSVNNLFMLGIVLNNVSRWSDGIFSF